MAEQISRKDDLAYHHNHRLSSSKSKCRNGTSKMMLHLRMVFSAGIFFFLLLKGPAPARQEYFTKQQVAEDLYQLKDLLEQTHYNLYAYTTKEQFLSAFKQAVQTLNRHDSLSLLATTSLFQQVVSSANTGHTEIDFPVSSYIAYAREGGTLFPIELALENNKALVRNNLSDNPKIEKGMQLISINGRNIDDIIKKIYPQISAERTYLKNAKLEFWSFPRLFWQVFDEQHSFSITLRKKDKTIQTTVSSISVEEYENKRNGEILSSERELSFPKQGVALLNPGPFSSMPPDGSEEYKNFIDSAFASILEKDTEVLIVDLRNNSGGHDDFSNYLVSYFADTPFRWYSQFTLKTSKILKEHTIKNNDTSDVYFRTILDKPAGETYDYDFKAYEPVKEEKRYSGQVYVLVNRQTYSMAAVTAAMIQDYGFATIVGEETADTPTLLASQFSYPLHNTGIMVKIPKGYIVRPDGSEKLRGVIPDISIPDHLLDDKDEILQGILKRL